ncbi:MAG TPA: glycosyltransferase [Pyrinomonadaceae bacterium]|nr:glycosyltransferase [Pyrinomonadaceae bacterium]
MSKKVTSLYICPWSLQDSLTQSQSLPYLKGLTNEGYKFALMTFENPAYRSESATEKRIKKDLVEQGIFWFPVRYRKGTSIFNKLYENASGFLTGLMILRKHRPAFIHSRSSLPSGIAAVLSKVFKLKFLYDADSMLSEEYADIGHWAREGKAYKLMSQTESFARRNATEMIVLTETLRDDLRRDYNVKIPIEVIPCCVDMEKFGFSREGRSRRRGELGLTDEKLLTYVGKVGSWYLVEETFDFFKAFHQAHPASRLLIVSRDDPEVFHRIAANRGISPDSYFVRSASHAEVAEWLSASDVGLCLIKQARSKRGSSPVKFAEYLSVGLPIVSTDGIGDCTRVIEKDNVGVILKKTGAADFASAVEQLLDLCAESREELSRRCRETAEKEFSLESVGGERYRKIYKRLSAVHR